MTLLSTPRLSPRQKEEQRLIREANGHFAPARPGAFFAQEGERRIQERERLINEFVRQGLDRFDQQNNQNTGVAP